MANLWAGDVNVGAMGAEYNHQHLGNLQGWRQQHRPGVQGQKHRPGAESQQTVKGQQLTMLKAEMDSRDL